MDCNPASAGGHHHIIMAIDYFTKWAEAMPTVKSDGEISAHFVFNQIIVRIINPYFTHLDINSFIFVLFS